MKPLRDALAAVLSLQAAMGGIAAAACAPPPPIDEVIATDPRSREADARDAEKPLRGFALFSYRDLADDIIDGDGIYLDTALGFFRDGCASDEIEANDLVTTRWLRVLLANTRSAPDFARRLSVAHALFEAGAPTPR